MTSTHGGVSARSWLTSHLAVVIDQCIAHGISLALFVIGLRHLGTVRTGAYFSVAPFFGAVLAIPLLGEPVSARLFTAGTLTALGVWLHLTERHRHEYTHEAMEHAVRSMEAMGGDLRI